MNIFRLVGDMLHLFSIITLLLKIHATKSCRGTLATDTVRNMPSAAVQQISIV